MNIIGRLRDHLDSRRPILPSERRYWADTHHLHDVAERTAQWLEGTLKSQPGYFGPCDVDEDDVPGLTDVLIACNRGGFLTRNSQAGFDGTGYDGAHWEQLAAVTGYAHELGLDRLRRLDGRYGLIAHEGVGRRRHRGKGVVVTWAGRLPFTEFGAQYDGVGFEFDGCGPDAVADLERAFQVTVYDPTPGRNSLWADLLAVWS